MICDLAETYHVLDYKALKPEMVGRLIAGLRQNSRLHMHYSESTVPQDTLFLAAIIDRLTSIYSAITGDKSTGSLVDRLINKPTERMNNVVGYNSIEEFMKTRYGG